MSEPVAQPVEPRQSMDGADLGSLVAMGWVEPQPEPSPEPPPPPVTNPFLAPAEPPPDDAA